jgi:hypothetical protein
MNIFYIREFIQWDAPRPVKLEGAALKQAAQLCPDADPNEALNELRATLPLPRDKQHRARLLFDARKGIPALERAKDDLINDLLDEINRAENEKANEEKETA